ncbi:small ribosomal subunit protein mS40 isoform X2 [Arvicanthis niloticus]|uniref:small ribosomal subunit protein mS40 isoform X2 n=1 Tax=Arvicanthis niloticus TaxID=61156 RepID=UPI00402B39AB
MDASLRHTLLRLFPTLLRSSYVTQVPHQTLCTRGPPEEDASPSLPVSPYEKEPWKYLDSEGAQGAGEVAQRFRALTALPKNVKLLEQFVCAHTGIIFHAPYTGVCMKQHKKLTQAIQKAREYGLLSYYVPQVEPRDADFRTVHGAVSVTPPAPTLLSGEPWYPWYSWQQPPERELSRLRRLYQGNLLEESGPPPESVPEMPTTPPAEASTEQTSSQSA